MDLRVNIKTRDLLIFHVLFVIVCVVVLLTPFSIGIRLFILVLIYNIFIPLIGWWRKYSDWVNIWLFAFILSLLQVFPDWFLATQLEVIVFPEDGLFKIGAVSGYMAGLWAIPLFIIVYVGQEIQKKYSTKIVYISTSLLSLLIFGVAEQTLWMIGSWYAQNVVMLGHMAVYIIIPEIILGLSTYYYYDKNKENNQWLKIPVAFIVMLLYIGSAGFFYFLFERILFQI